MTKHLEPPRSSSSVVEWLLTRAAGKPSAQALNGMLTRLSKPVVLDAVKGTSRSHKARANTRLSRNGVGACGPAHRAAARASPGGGALRLGCSWSALEPLRASWREYVHTEMAGVAGGGASGGGQAGSSTAGGGAPRPAVSITSLSRDEAVARRVGSLDLHGCPVKVARCSSTPSLVGCHGMVVLETQSAYHVALCPDSASASCVQGAGGTPSSLGPQCRGSAQPASAGSVPGAGLPMPAAKDVHVAVLVKDGTALEVPLPLGGSGASPATALILHPRNKTRTRGRVLAEGFPARPGHGSFQVDVSMASGWVWPPWP